MHNNDNKKPDTKDIQNAQEMSNEEKKEKVLKEFMEKMTVELPFNGLTQNIKKDVVKIKENLQELKKEIEEKKDSVENQQNSLKEKLDKLVAEGKLKVNQAEYRRSQQSFEHYKKVLENIGAEVGSELNFCMSIASDVSPKTIRVMKSENQNLDNYIKSKIDWLKKYVKKVTKDLRVSYSKYNFGLESQLRNLGYLEAYFKKTAK